MKKLIALTILLIAAITVVTLLYFKNLHVPGRDTERIMESIPADAALIMGINNDDSFYDVYDSSALFTALAGTEQLHELKILRQQLLHSALLNTHFNNQTLYVSVHAGGNLLLTFSSNHTLPVNQLAALLKQNKGVANVTPQTFSGNKGLSIQLTGLNRPFQLIERGKDIYSGSFSPEVIEAISKSLTQKSRFKPLPDQQQGNVLANLYINYAAFNPLVGHWFKAANADFINPLTALPAQAALTLNYKSDALMFNGYTSIEPRSPATYLTLFANQQPYVSELKSIFPLITAYSTCFSVSDPALFQHNLVQWQNRAGLKPERDALLQQIKSETGVDAAGDFNSQLGNEFAIVTTRFDEKIAIIQLKNGSKLLPSLANISIATEDNTGRFNYNKLPFFLLGDAFSAFKRPYFWITDNYLFLANTAAALKNYQAIYSQRTFLPGNNRFNEFSNLMSERSNICFFINYKNAAQLLKRDLQPAAYQTLYPKDKNAGSYYAGSYQLSSADKQFYTNLCLQLNKPDTVLSK
ncbi:hypothetical protein GCM10027037_13460 [Mucilaginibacter koreensis]